MKKIADKVVLLAHMAISAIFVLVTILMFVNVIPLTFDNGILVIDGFVLAMVMILAGIYVALTAYLLYSIFAQRNVIKQVLLYADEYNETNATSTVIRKIANSSAKLVSGVKVKKLRITAGDKGKLHMRLTVAVDSDDVSYTIDTLRCLLVDHYATVLSLTFDSIDFSITRIHSSRTPDMTKAKTQAEALRAGRVVAQEIAEQPIVEVGCIESEVVSPQETTEKTEGTAISQNADDDLDALELLREQKRKDYERQASTMYGTPEASLVDDISVEITDSQEEVTDSVADVPTDLGETDSSAAQHKQSQETVDVTEDKDIAPNKTRTKKSAKKQNHKK